MTFKTPPSYEELQKRLKRAEDALQAVRDGQVDAIVGNNHTLVVRLAEAEAREAHIKNVLLTIRSVNKLLVSEETPLSLIEKACIQLTAGPSYQNAWIALADSQTHQVTAVKSGRASGGFLQLERQLMQGAYPRCVRQSFLADEVTVVRDARRDCPECPLTREYGGWAVFTCRLGYKDRIHGVLSVSVPEELAGNQEEQVLFRELANDIGFALDKMAAQQQAEKRIALLGRMLDLAPASITIHDFKGRFHYGNQATYTLHGYADEEEFLNTDLHNLDAPETRAMLPERYRKIREKGEARFEVLHHRKDGSTFPLEVLARFIEWDGKPAILSVAADITERKKAEEALRESESRVRTKLNALLDPEGDIGRLNLADVLDVDQIQSLMDDFHALTDIGVGIIDLEGNVLVGTGWQDVCTKFHRVHPETALNCRESDTLLASTVEPGTFKLYKCKNNMWDMATPIVIGGRHAGNLFLGQFFFEDETPDVAAFREQARRYGFDEEAYLKAYLSVPRWSRKTVDQVMTFYCNLINLISRMSYAHIKLARTSEALRQSEQLFRSFVENANDIVYALSAEGRFTYVSPNWLEFLGEPAERAVGKSFEPYVHPEDVHLCRAFLEKTVMNGGKQGGLEYRVRHHDGSWRWHMSKGSPNRDESGKVTGYVGIARDVTEAKQAEEALKASEMRFKEMLRNVTSVAVQGYALDGAVSYWNHAAETFYGYTEEEALGQNLIDLIIPPAMREAVQTEMRQMAETGEAIPPSELELMRKDGSPIQVYSSHALVRLPGREPELFCIDIDLTEHKLAEKKLREEREQLLAIFNSIDEVIYISDPATHELLYVNSYFQRMLPPDCLGAKCYKIIQNLDSPCPFCTNDIILKQKPASHHWEFHNKHVDRHYAIADRIISWPDGRDVRFEIAIDITKRKHLERRNQVLANIIKRSQDFIGVADTDQAAYFVNPAGQAMVGLDGEEAVAQTRIEDYFLPDDLPYLRNTILPAVMRDGRWAGEFRFRHFKTGEAIPVLYDLFHTEDIATGDMTDLATITRNITERKQAEAEREQLHAQLTQAQKMESVGRLAGGVAHDFNNMLNVIIGYSELALDGMPPAHPFYESFREILDAAMRSSEVTRQLLAFARKQTIAPRVLDLNETLEGMLKMLRRLIGEDIRMIWKPGSETWFVRMDPSQLDQLLANLCVNARDAISSGGEICISVHNEIVSPEACIPTPDLKPGDYVLLSVKDNGCGMDRETMANIFEPFFTTKKPDRGTGLGLSTIYGIVKQNDGAVLVESEPGKGALFKIYLPRHGSPETASEALQAAEPLEGKGETVLLVEDEKAIISMAKSMLERSGYRVLTASSPQKALNLVDEFQDGIQLLITDVIMPGMNGKDLAEELKSRHPSLKVLFMSGYTADLIARHGVLEKDVHFLEKPFSQNKLAEQVRKALES
ncbi:PAS domain S-box protein [Desulfatibacillum aliphaticivorans]|uniref:PAS domain S-box protein n=1 Tax=Desulfatibacillum aliphaticivorans TaxID=218208 RepID=UPI00040DB3AD|nr:PAS domain S-box protein [Desulfatibacillum aliphaticivorans]